ncbi:hypothetical protein Tco_0434938 [Tanacetum coccineum]
MPPKRMSTSEAPATTHAAIRKLVADSVFAALEAQAANMANTDNTTRPREALWPRQMNWHLVVPLVPDSEKMGGGGMEVSSGDCSKLLKGIVTALYLNTIEEAFNIAKRANGFSINDWIIVVTREVVQFPSTVETMIIQVTRLDGIINDAISLVDVAAAKELVSSSMVDENVAKEKPSSSDETTGLESRKKLNFHTLFTPGGNGIDVVILVKLHGVPVTDFSEDGLSAIDTKLSTPLMLDSYTSDMCMQSWGRSSYARAMIKLRADVELKDNILWYQWGTTDLVNNKANSNGSSLMNVDNSSTGTAPIIDKIGKFEDLLTSGQAILMDEAGNPLKKVEFSGDYECKDKVASVDNDMPRSLASERVGFGTQSLLE